MFKLIRRLVLFVVVLAIAALVGLYFVDDLVESGVEKGGTWALGTTTSVDDTDLGIFSGTLDMGDLRVANPEGFRAENFLHVGSVSCDLPFGTLFSDTIEMQQLRLEKVRVGIERGGSGTNYGKIMESLERFGSEDKQGADGKRFVIRELLLQDVRVDVQLLPLGGQLTTIPLTIPEIRLKDVGAEGKQGVLLGELSSIIVTALLANIASAGGLPKSLAADLGTGVGGLLQAGGYGAAMLEQLRGSKSGLGGALEGLLKR